MTFLTGLNHKTELFNPNRALGLMKGQKPVRSRCSHEFSLGSVAFTTLRKKTRGSFSAAGHKKLTPGSDSFPPALHHQNRTWL